MIKTWIICGFGGWLVLMILIVTIKVMIGYRFSDKSLIGPWLTPYRSWQMLQWIFRGWTIALGLVGLLWGVITIIHYE